MILRPLTTTVAALLAFALPVTAAPTSPRGTQQLRPRATEQTDNTTPAVCTPNQCLVGTSSLAGAFIPATPSVFGSYTSDLCSSHSRYNSIHAFKLYELGHDTSARHLHLLFVSNRQLVPSLLRTLVHGRGWTRFHDIRNARISLHRFSTTGCHQLHRLPLRWLPILHISERHRFHQHGRHDHQVLPPVRKRLGDITSGRIVWKSGRRVGRGCRRRQHRWRRRRSLTRPDPELGMCDALCQRGYVCRKLYLHMLPGFHGIDLQ